MLTLASLQACRMPTVTAHAATYYVATAGSNSNPGTEKQPWRTVAYAVATMVAGDTTYVRGGTYDEEIIRFKRSGTQAAPIKLLNYPGEAPVINFIDKNRVHRFLIQHATGHTNPMGWITIEGFEIASAYDGIKIYNGHDLTIRRNWIHDSLHQGILGNGTRILIDRNKISHNGDFSRCVREAWYCNQDHGIYFHGSAITITNNLIYDNLAYGIQLNGSPTSTYSSTKHAGQEFAGAANWVIAHNTLAYQANRGGMVVWGSQCGNARIENNIFYENSVNQSNSAQGIDFVSTSCTGIAIRNNLAYATSPGGTVFLGSGTREWVHYTHSGNIVNTLNPRFVNAPAMLPDSPNFALTAGSPAIDAGVPLVAISTAFDGTPRPQGRASDIGAYEYTADGNIKPPITPTDLPLQQ
jgi:hypothetical protein